MTSNLQKPRLRFPGSLIGSRQFALVVLVLVVGGIVRWMRPGWPDFDDLANVAVECILATGMTVLVIGRGIDLSIGATMALSGLVSAVCLLGGWPIVPSILAGLFVGAMIGAINGFLVAKVHVNRFVATLATMGMICVVIEVIIRGTDASPVPEGFRAIGQGRLMNFSAAAGGLRFDAGFALFLALALAVIADLLLKRSRFFRQNYFIGANEKAALLSGLNVGWVKLVSYTLMGLLAAVAGIFAVAQAGSATAAGMGIELKVIAGVLLGGVRLRGGEGTVLGAMLGVLLVSILFTALSLTSVSVLTLYLILGAVLVCVAVFDRSRTG